MEVKLQLMRVTVIVTQVQMRANVPMKEATPMAPVITSDEASASVTVTPQSDADKMTIHYVAPNGEAKEVVATKVGNQWTLNDTPTGISIDNTSGAVTVNYQGVQNGSEVTANESHGNSDASTEESECTGERSNTKSTNNHN